MSERLPAACAEFPNDNPALHLGAIWCCEELNAAPVCVGPPPALRPEEPAEVEVREPTPTIPEAPALVAHQQPSPEPVEDLEIEVVDELIFEDAIDESPATPAATESSPPCASEEDAFATLVRVVEDVAIAAGASPDALSMLRGLLGKARLDADAPAAAKDRRAQAAAWQAILRGDSEDFAACGSSALDEWCAALVAQVIDAPARADALRRELRQRGVAAFGMVADAA